MRNVLRKKKRGGVRSKTASDKNKKSQSRK